MTIREQRTDLIKKILEDDSIVAQEEDVLHMLLQENISRDSAAVSDSRLTVGQKAADAVARFAGSWGFIIIFFLMLMMWIVINTVFLTKTKAFDPYPFILMNLILSCIAAIQAPIIMMSQNRQEEKDRQRAKNDYQINLKAEIIIEDIHQKLDAIITMQQELTEKLASEITKQ